MMLKWNEVVSTAKQRVSLGVLEMRKKREMSTQTFLICALLVIVSVIYPLETVVYILRPAPKIREYNGYLNQEFNGTYHAVLVGSDWVFYLETDRGFVQLIFYCGPYVSGYNLNGMQYKRYTGYCANEGELPLISGERLHVRGTMLVPSDWHGHDLEFFGDLYVFKYCTLTVCVET
jgi:hypothetical protein